MSDKTLAAKLRKYGHVEEADAIEAAQAEIARLTAALETAFDFLGGVDGAAEVRDTILAALKGNQPMMSDKTLVEEIARAISVPEHHTTWDLLTEVQKDLYRMQAQAAAAIAERRMEEMREKVAKLQELLVCYGDRIRMAKAEPAERQWLIDEAFECAALRPSGGV